MILVANAPVSYGIFELTSGDLADPDDLLDAVADAGYSGVDLGPVGFLGDPQQVVARLDQRGLGLSGGWVELRLVDPQGFSEDLQLMEQALDVFAAAREADPERAPKPTLADAGSPARRAHPGRSKDLPAIRLDGEGWNLLARHLADAATRCRDRGLEPTFHPHLCTHVEGPQEIERFLEISDVDMCLDTGHLLLGGTDPVDALERWRSRVNHVHVKDARLSVLDEVTREGAGKQAVWDRGAWCELGTGDLQADAFLDALHRHGYQGWLVVEQDRIPRPGEDLSGAAAAQMRNRTYLEKRGF